MKKLSPRQRKALSDFANMVAAAWFTAGVISPSFMRSLSFINLMPYIFVGLIMTGATLFLSLFLVKEI